MERESIASIIETAAMGIEIIGVAVIVGIIAFGGLLCLIRSAKRQAGVFREYKVHIGRALQMGLEFLVAADIIRTVTVQLTFRDVATLGLLVFVRTFLSWSLAVETEGRWPWQAAEKKGR
jgi:uncharacterized membrane protein